MKTYKFIPYFTGEPLVKIQFSYNETTMFKTEDGVTYSRSLTPDQVSDLNSMHADEQMRAAYVWGEAGV